MSAQSDKKIGILLAAFGSGSPVGHQTLASFEDRVRAIYPDTVVRWAFTSETMRSRLLKSRVKSDSVHKALMRMSFEKIGHIAIQPLHIIPGVEYEDLLEEVDRARHEAGISATVGTPLLQTPKDVQKTARALLEHLPAERSLGEAVVCMGHGSWHKGKYWYDALSKELRKNDPCIFIGTLEGHRSIETIIPKLSSIFDSYKEFADKDQLKMDLCRDRVVWLLPLLSVIGKHAMHDMAGNQQDSWKSCLLSAGYDCRAVLKGTAEYEGFINIWVEHLVEAVEALKDL